MELDQIVIGLLLLHVMSHCHSPLLFHYIIPFDRRVIVFL